MLFVVGGDGAELRFLAAGRDHELIVEKQRCAAFTLSPALLAITEKLVDGLRNGFLHLGRLALDHYHRQAIEEKHDVRDNVVLRAENAHLKLADGDETVVVPILEVDELHRRALLTRLAVLTDASVFQKLVEHMSVVLKQIGAGEIGRELFHHLIHLIVFQPWVDHFKLLLQHRQHHDLSKIRPMAIATMLHGFKVNDFPAKTGELVEQRLLDVLPFVETELFGCVLGAHVGSLRGR